MVKFRIGFTMSAETLFGLLAKFLPMENLDVVEINEKPISTPHISKPVERIQSTKLIRKPRQKQKSRYRLKVGINQIIIEHLSDGKSHNYAELQPLLEKHGYSRNSVASRLSYLSTLGIVERAETAGYWKLKQTQIQEST